MKHNHPKGSELYERELELSTYEGEDKVITSPELADEIARSPRTAHSAATGMASLDRILGGGVEAGELVVVTGPTGEGKTTLLMTITKNMAAAQEKTLWFTLEVTPRQFLEKIQSGADTMPLFYIPRNPVDHTDENYVARWEAKHKRKYEMVDWIEDRIIEAKVKYEDEGKKLKAVFIDHVHQLFSSTQFNTNLSLEIGDLVARIKELALHYDLTVYLIAHCKDVPSDTNRDPRMSDIRDSGMIIRLADTVLGVWRIKNDNDGTQKKGNKPLEETDNKAKITVFKNRRTGKLGFFTAYHRNHYLSEDPF